MKRLACLTATISNIQSNINQFQRTYDKIELFYKINMNQTLKYIDQQWALHLDELQRRVFQPTDMILVIVCRYSSNRIRIYQYQTNHQWTYPLTDKLSGDCLCQPVLVLRQQHDFHYRFGIKQWILTGEQHLSIEKCQTSEPFMATSQEYRLVLTLRNDAAIDFRSRTQHVHVV
jgi:hypothetical protein